MRILPCGARPSGPSSPSAGSNPGSKEIASSGSHAPRGNPVRPLCGLARAGGTQSGPDVRAHAPRGHERGKETGSTGARMRSGDTYTVVGAGGVGCAVGYALRATGARVCFVEADAARVSWAREPG